jgi:preprotein translocase subunit SecA
VHVQDEGAIQSSQGLDSLAALDPEAEYRSRLADAFSMHYRRVAENASRSIFLSLHELGSEEPQWVAVQKAQHRTPADEADVD